MVSAINLKIASIAAILNAVFGLTTFIIVLGWVGITADSEKFAAMARSNPLPLILLDVLKVCMSIAFAILVIYFYQQFKTKNSGAIKWATIFAVLSIIFLLKNAAISMFLVLSPSWKMDFLTAELMATLNILIIVLAFSSIFLSGLWYLVINNTARKHHIFEKSFCYLGVALGVVSLLPPLALVVLILSIIWCSWLGILLLKDRQLLNNSLS
jgi:hypothetical protein